MSISLLSLKSEESKAITNGKYKCKLDGSNLVITDGINTWTITQSDLSILEQQLISIINTKANLIHTHVITDITDYSVYDDSNCAKLDANNTFTGNNTFSENISAPNITTITNTLATKANTIHTHKTNDISRDITTINEEEEEITETIALDDILDSKANINHNHDLAYSSINHTHEIADIYKTITTLDLDTQTTTTTVKSLETLLNEREADIKTLINSKANSSHFHQATEVMYQENETVKQKIDSIMSKLQVVDSQGHSLDILKILFGAEAIVGGAIDGGLAYSVATLQTEVATLQGQIAALMGSELSDDVLEVLDTAGDVANTSSSVMDSLRSFANCFSRLRNSIQGYSQVTTQVITPVTSGIGEMAGLIAL